jgi:hypothetical protein
MMNDELKGENAKCRRQRWMKEGGREQLGAEIF